MKKSICCFLFALLLVTCRYDSIFDEYGFYGEGTAKMNGQTWGGKAGIFPSTDWCKTDTCIAIKILRSNSEGFLRNDLTFDHIPLKKGRKTFNYRWSVYKDALYKLTYSEWGSDGDVITGGYYVYEQNDENFLEITHLDLKTGDIRGIFQATVVRGSSWTPLGRQSDTIRIRDDSFYGKIFRE
jgi:hypothetical protein